MEHAEPTVVSTDPVKENVIKEETIDPTVTAAPIFRFSEGAQIKTFGTLIVMSQTANGQTGSLHAV
ncbi:uncharacterized protein TrAtP1_013291 [Trichoderma atroviride]|uniref:uncharacterized protein n=1 Tax=Hypocrea atroviridis TaxID=63577 RepID=UPI003321C6AE|nr:hypothetical protein TrAtP1_013291 [Trichoderma atroviride]